jgi:hypothetical protein
MNPVLATDPDNGSMLITDPSGDGHASVQPPRGPTGSPADGSVSPVNPCRSLLPGSCWPPVYLGC